MPDRVEVAAEVVKIAVAAVLFGVAIVLFALVAHIIIDLAGQYFDALMIRVLSW